MTTMNKFGSVLGLAAVLTLGACETMNTPANTSNYPQSTSSSGVYSGYGVVQSIELVRQSNTGIGGSGIGIGTIAGAVVGGVVGNQVGSGRGNTAATVIGAAGGAYAGHELEKRSQQQSDAYKLAIRMDSGSYQTLTQTTVADLRVGDRVQIDNGVARRY
ncbi:MAG: glycine zipper 2TM domain-containing protein [Sulfuricaulis sp.]|nr:glycine zipper 2TM domain-containing protein [Sulfuricaulis sp.]